MYQKTTNLLIFTFFCTSAGISQSPASEEYYLSNNALVVSAISGSILYSGALLYNIYLKDAEYTSFHFKNDWKAYLQADKFKHAFNTYLITGTGYKIASGNGINKQKALLIGSVSGILMLTPYEIIDGFSDLGGFSWGDISANFFGIALFAGQEALFNEQAVKFKFSFSPSPYSKQANGLMGNNLLQNLFLDNNGHTYWFSTNLNRVVLKNKLPSWLCISAGYSANGMFGEFENLTSFDGVELPETKRYRQFLISLDIDWTKIKTRSGFLKLVLEGLNFIKMPFPAIEINTLGKLKGYWIYF